MLTIEEVKKEFQGTNFHELEEKFKEYGVEAAFKPGKKKKDIIEEAMKLLEEISVEEPAPDSGDEELRNEGIEAPGTEPEVPGDESKAGEAPKKEAAKLKVEVNVKGMTKDQILKALHNIKLNMISATETQMRILRAKRNVLSAQLEKLD